MRHLLCRIRGHRRSVRHARRTHDGWQSICTCCGGKLVRIARSDWIFRRNEAPAAEPRFQQEITFRPTNTVIRVRAPAP